MSMIESGCVRYPMAAENGLLFTSTLSTSQFMSRQLMPHYPPSIYPLPVPMPIYAHVKVGKVSQLLQSNS